MKNMMIAVSAITVCTMVGTAFANHDKHNMEQKTQHYFKKIDTDGNGKISKAEQNAFSVKMFDEADMNKDGSLTLAEVQSHKMKKKEEYKRMKNKNDKNDDDNDNM